MPHGFCVPERRAERLHGLYATDEVGTTRDSAVALSTRTVDSMSMETGLSPTASSTSLAQSSDDFGLSLAELFGAVRTSFVTLSLVPLTSLTPFLASIWVLTGGIRFVCDVVVVVVELGGCASVVVECERSADRVVQGVCHLFISLLSHSVLLISLFSFPFPFPLRTLAGGPLSLVGGGIRSGWGLRWLCSQSGSRVDIPRVRQRSVK